MNTNNFHNSQTKMGQMMQQNSENKADFQRFVDEIQTFLAATNMYSDLPRRLAYAGDASFYRLIPKLVVNIDTLEQLTRLVACANTHKVALTFRAAGTSLSGQAVTDSVLVLLSEHWRGAKVLDEGKKIWLQPGVIGAHANQLLKPLGRKIGPDPASIDSCKIGGIAANNASGMCCGVKQNSYHTVADIHVVLADGSRLDTADSTSVQAFVAKRPQLLDGLSELAQKVKSNPVLSEKIRHKYRLKNTTGYGINALLDFDQPLEILKHLMIGSEGTLGFIADITYHTVVDEAFRATGLFVFADIRACCEAVQLLASAPVSAVELMDARALRSVAEKPAMPAGMAALKDNAAALLIEVAGEDEAMLAAHLHAVSGILAGFESSMLAQVSFSQEPARNQALWAIRKGTFPAVGAVRPAGTTVIIEDVAFPVAQLAEGVEKLQALLVRFDYPEAIIFGHALEGNLHFVFTQSFNQPSEVQRYGEFMQAVGELVAVEFGGSLKAEHGTGRNMAPFVKLEWGEDAYQLMEDIKALFDPSGVLNPGVIINHDANAHLKDLKPIPSVHTELDKCIECGFCEAVCPSRELSLTPRQRIALHRQIQDGDSALTGAEKAQLKEAYQYLAVDTCAATGLCAMRCPVGINTGDFIKSLRAEQPTGKWLAGMAAEHFAAAGVVARFALNASKVTHNVLGDSATGALFRGLNKVTAGAVPIWYPAWPGGAKGSDIPEHPDAQAVVYFPTCANRMFDADSHAEDRRPLPEVMASVLAKAGYRVLIPDNLQQLCCGMPWDSKGHQALAKQKRQQSAEALLQLAKERELPIVVDASPCALQFSQEGLNVQETAQFLHQYVLPNLHIRKQQQPVMLHVTCSSKRLHAEQQLVELARACAEDVVIPKDIQCCGFAGDKGFFTPELNASALKGLKQQIPSGCHQGVSNSRTCEIGLSQHSGIPYQSILYLLDKVSERQVETA
ncbi:FAD-binding and (Fe-S)-binding domain-containing protein [Bowmanella yangjiangensis]|uniref:FAD-binding and (Fe-S)-binding domain-containing protein n=1 Tax=Bowmanella yangjiangensis TaxID=2811230 RepID=UPI001E3B5BA1|nr:FAD-binding and (Fe-S)-binding domain-containing protein [Bowmanella yangjiangensis]